MAAVRKHTTPIAAGAAGKNDKQVFADCSSADCMCAYPQPKRQPTLMTWLRSALYITRSGYSESDHIVRPLARRGASQEGMEVSRETLQPELTVSLQGVYWHPLSTDDDMLVSHTIFPLSEHVNLVSEKLQGAQALQTVQ
jgi:hypothetical protein